MDKQTEKMTVLEAIEEQDEVDKNIKKYFARRKQLSKKIKGFLPLLNLMEKNEADDQDRL